MPLFDVSSHVRPAYVPRAHSPTATTMLVDAYDLFDNSERIVRYGIGTPPPGGETVVAWPRCPPACAPTPTRLPLHYARYTVHTGPLAATSPAFDRAQRQVAHINPRLPIQTHIVIHRHPDRGVATCVSRPQLLERPRTRGKRHVPCPP